MNRYLAFLLAVMCATLTVSSACVAAPFEWVSFTLQPDRTGEDCANRKTDGESLDETGHATLHAATFGGRVCFVIVHLRHVCRSEVATPRGTRHDCGQCRHRARAL